MNNQIFIGIPVMHDLDIYYTLENCLKNADNPENIHFGVYAYIHTEAWRNKMIDLCEATPNMSLATVPLTYENLGIGKGRKGAGFFYQGQEYVMSIDSHTKFVEGWDTLLKKALNKLEGKKAILTGMAGWYKDDKWIEGREKLVYPRFDKEKRGYYWYNPGHSSVHVPEYTDTFDYDPNNDFAECVLWNGNFSFSKYNFFADITDIPFFPENWIQTIELRYLGYELFTPLFNQPSIGHLYQPMDSYYGHSKVQDSKRYSLDDFLTEEEIDKYKLEASERFVNYCKTNPEKVAAFENYIGMPCYIRAYYPQLIEIRKWFKD